VIARNLVSPLAAFALLTLSAQSHAAVVSANPSNYRTLLSSLQPGDTLQLAAGTYTQGLPVGGKAGTASAPIIIRGPDDQSAIFQAQDCCNTVQFNNGASYVQVLNLTLDGLGKDGPFGVDANGNTHHITLENLKIVGYNGSANTPAISTAAGSGDRVEVEDLSGGDRVELRSLYPEHCNCQASVNFTVQVPRGAKYSFDKIGSASGDVEIRQVMGEINGRSASGDVTIDDVQGNITASSASGNVRVTKATGTVNAHSASGDVEVDLAGIEGTGNMEFTSASGNVRVKAPESLDADVDMSCTSGDIKTDFALQMEKAEHGPRRHAFGRLGSGSRTVKIRSASGDVSLVHN